jgi:hypothetical protein
VFGPGTNYSTSTDGLIAQFLTDAGDPSLLSIPAGAWLIDLYFNASSAGGTPNFYVELYKYDGAIFTLIASNSATPEFITNGTSVDLYTTSLAVPTTTLAITDRLAIRVYVACDTRTITLHTENGNLSQVITTFSTGISALNGLIAQVQFLSTGTTGTDFNINSATNTHTFNLPVASATNTGKLSSTDWTTFNGKQDVISLTTTGTSGAATFIANTLNIPQYQAALTNPVTGTGTTNYVPKWASSSSLGDSLIVDNGVSVGVNVVSPASSAILDVTSTTKGFLPPRMTTVDRNAIAAPAQGLILYNTTSDRLTYRDVDSWEEVATTADIAPISAAANLFNYYNFY